MPLDLVPLLEPFAEFELLVLLAIDEFDEFLDGPVLEEVVLEEFDLEEFEDNEGLSEATETVLDGLNLELPEDEPDLEGLPLSDEPDLEGLPLSDEPDLGGVPDNEFGKELDFDDALSKPAVARLLSVGVEDNELFGDPDKALLDSKVLVPVEPSVLLEPEAVDKSGVVLLNPDFAVREDLAVSAPVLVNEPAVLPIPSDFRDNEVLIVEVLILLTT